MESSLNLVWMTMATLMFWLWMRHAASKGGNRRTQLFALAVVVLILLPVISVTDDLMAAQNPAETDCCQRKDHSASIPHSVFPAIAALPPPVLAELNFSFLRYATPSRVPAPQVDNPAMAPIQNRPPPTA
jgi:hypothetical protein